MINPKFQTPYQRIELPPLILDPEDKVERGGYRPIQVMVEEFVQAGIRLEIARGYEFPGDEEPPDDYEDPTRKPGVDPLDVRDMDRATLARLKKAQKDKEAREIADAEAKAEAKEAPET